MKEETIKQMVKAGMSTKEIAVEFSVTQRSVQKWLKALGLNRSISEAHKLRTQQIKRKEEERQKKKKETIKQMVKAGMSTKEIAIAFGVNQRTAQKWLKALGLNGSKSQAHLLKTEKTRKKIRELKFAKKEPKFNKVQGDFAIYRFLDISGQVLYVGKCERSIHSNGHGGEREYFLKERISQHFAPSCKHLPQFVYNSTTKIEYAIVNTAHECLSLETDLILHYKMKNQCIWNGQFSILFKNEFNINEVNWIPYWQRETKEYLC